MTGIPGEQMVPNPEYAALRDLKKSVQDDAASIEAALRETLKWMTSGNVWVGPTADDFTSECQEKRRRVNRLAQQLVDDVDAQLASTPKEIPYSQYYAMQHIPGY